MKTPVGHLTYCTNIHAGKNWAEDFENLKIHFPEIKRAVSPDAPMGIGLRLGHAASIELEQEEKLAKLISWLDEQQAYIFTMNGFPYGEFHHTVVKADVHTPDWTTAARTAYTIRLFKILARLLPADQEGGISTSPLSYRHWFKTEEELKTARQLATQNMVAVLKELILIRQQTGKYLHLDIEPEPDGVLETGEEYLDWYTQELLPAAIPALAEAFDLSAAEATLCIKQHICLCYDICHFSIGYEAQEKMLETLHQQGLKIGKIQISAALKARMHTPEQRMGIRESFQAYNESVYLHQVVALQQDRTCLRYTDLPEALADFDHPDVLEWRAHFHVPVSLNRIGLLQTTQSDIIQVLKLQKQYLYTVQLEVETYTWEVLPESIKQPVAQSIIQELKWVLQQITEHE